MRALWILVLGVLIGHVPAHAGDWSRLERRMSELVAGTQAEISGVAVIVVADGQTLFAKAQGRAVIDAVAPDRERPLTLDSPVRVASISKLPVSLAVLRLAEQERIDLDGDIGKVLGYPVRNPHHPDLPITPRMLLSHTSSLRDGDTYGLPLSYSLRDLLQSGGPFDPDGMRWANSAPGTYFTYTNLNYGVLGTLIEKVTGQRFDAVVADMVLRPLGMGGAYDVRRLTGTEFQALAPVYRRGTDGQWMAQVDDHRGVRPNDQLDIFGVKAQAPLSAYVPGRNASTLSPQGGLRASARDLEKLLRWLLARGRTADILSPTGFDVMMKPVWTFDGGNGDSDGGLLRQWGLGIQCTTHSGGPGDGDRWTDAVDGPRLCGHFGDAYGLLGAVMADTGGRFGFVYLITGTGVERAQAVGRISSLTHWESDLVTGILTGLADGARPR